jgi:quercetin dioxygenase-like cupin family protein
MRVIRGREADTPSDNRTPTADKATTFTGTVWADVLMGGEQGATVNNVWFGPRSRTYWHTHDVGQILQVIAGSGFVVTRDGSSEAIRAGDIAWIPAGEEHWHGGAPGSFLLHTATSIGTTRWLEEVSDADYDKGVGA